MLDSFVFELLLQTTPSDNKNLEKRLNAGVQINNGCLSELFKQDKLFRESRAYQKVIKLPKSKERSSLLRKLEQNFGLTDYGIQDFALALRKRVWFGDCIDAFTAQKIATKVYVAFREWKFRKKGRPRFKRYSRFRSLEGKSNTSGIRYKEGIIHWNELRLKCLFDPKDKDGVQAHALSSPIKYVRLVKRTIKGRIQWYAQLVLGGKPLIKAKQITFSF
jgi:putative transposase